MVRQRALSTSLAAVLLGCLAGAALAHGGAYQPPPESVGGGTSVGPGIPDGGPTTPSGETSGPITPSGRTGPLPGDETGTGTDTAGPPRPARSGLRQWGLTAPGSWEHWWHANRVRLIGRSARVRDRYKAARTGNERELEPQDQLWRAEVRVALLEALRSYERDVATGAAIAIGKAGHAEDAAALTRLLLDARRPQSVREAAALGLGLLPTSGGLASRTARDALSGLVVYGKESTRLRATAIYALGLRGESASIPLLLEAAGAGGASWDIPCAGMAALGLSGVELVRADLEGFLEGPPGGAKRKRETVRRVYAAQALARLDDARSHESLKRAAHDSERQVRRAAILALACVADAEDGELASYLIHTLGRSKDEPSRAVAALALGRLGCPSGAAPLRYAYTKGPYSVRPYAALGLGMLGARPENDAIRAKLRSDLARDPSGALCIAVGLSGDEKSGPILREVLRDSRDPKLRAHAALAIGLVDDREGGAAALRATLETTNIPELQREAALALGMLGDRKAVKVLLRVLAESDSTFAQGSAAVALGRIGGSETATALVEMLGDRKQPAFGRGMAAVGLGLLLDTDQGQRLAAIGSDLNWYLFTPTVREVLTIL